MSLADELLADLEDLQEEIEETPPLVVDSNNDPPSSRGRSLEDAVAADEESLRPVKRARREEEEVSEDVEMQVDEEEDFKGGHLAIPTVQDMRQTFHRVRRVHETSKLHQSERLKRLLEAVDQSMAQDEQVSPLMHGSVEDHPEYQTIVDANTLSVDIEGEILNVHKYIRDLYCKKFPELDSLVLHPLEYAKTVQVVQNETHISKLDDELRAILTPATVMVVTVTATTTKGVALTPLELEYVLEGCDLILFLDQCRSKIIEYVRSRMDMIAPNLSAIVGSTTAAQLMGAAGGLSALSRIPACNLPALGANKKIYAGFSSKNPTLRMGFLHHSDLIQRTYGDFKTRALRVVSAKAVLATRVDAAHESTDGAIGKAIREEIERKLEKWLEPPPNRATKALPTPDEAPKKRRGGRRSRKIKEMYATTELQKQQNRMAFNKAEEEVIVFDESEGLGMINQSLGSGRVRALQADTRTKVKVPKSLQALKQQSSGATSGLSSSLVFTPVQGLELVDPEAQKQKLKELNDKWFASHAEYLHVKK